jgi:hypothetical protein
MACSSSIRPVGTPGGENEGTPESRRVCELNRNDVPTKKNTGPQDINNRYSICKSCGANGHNHGSKTCLRGDDRTVGEKSLAALSYLKRSKAASKLRESDTCAARKPNEGIADGSSMSRVLVFTRDKHRNDPIQDLSLVRFKPQQKIGTDGDKEFYKTFSKYLGITLIDPTMSDKTLFASPNLDALAIQYDPGGKALHYMSPTWSPKDQTWARLHSRGSSQILSAKYPYRILTRRNIASPTGFNDNAVIRAKNMFAKELKNQSNNLAGVMDAYDSYLDITSRDGVNLNIETNGCTNPSHHFLTDLNYKRKRDMDSIFGIKVHQRPSAKGEGISGSATAKGLPWDSGNFPPLVRNFSRLFFDILFILLNRL